MRLGLSARTSLRALSAHKTRALLALISIGAGVAALILISAISGGMEREVAKQMQSMGSNLLVVRPAQVTKSVARTEIRGVVTSLDLDDYAAIATLASVARAAPGVEGAVRIKSSSNIVLTKVLGTTQAFPAVRQFRLGKGRFFNADESDSAERVVVLGARISTALFGGVDPIGREIRLRGVPYEVIGVLEPKGVLADGSDEDNLVIVPARTALRRILNVTWLSTVFVSVQDPRQMDSTVTELRELLRDRHRLSAAAPDDFAIQNTARMLEMQRRATASLSLFGTGLAAVALLLGGAGILALMLLSVKERTTEIGLRMAVGARRRDILMQFLLEASLLAFGGWAGGALLAASAAGAIVLGTQWAVVVPSTALLVSLVMASVVGLGFGLWPARQAALMPPIAALTMK